MLVAALIVLSALLICLIIRDVRMFLARRAWKTDPNREAFGKAITEECERLHGPPQEESAPPRSKSAQVSIRREDLAESVPARISRRKKQQKTFFYSKYNRPRRQCA